LEKQLFEILHKHQYDSSDGLLKALAALIEERERKAVIDFLKWYNYGYHEAPDAKQIYESYLSSQGK
jgi:thiamine monophosphate kinase